MNVAVVVPPGRLPQWHAWCIDALLADPRLSVRVVTVSGPHARAPRGIAARFRRTALELVDVPRGEGSLDGAAAIVDLTVAGVAGAAAHGVWRFELGDDDDRAQPFAREIGAGRATIEARLIRRRSGVDEVVRSGRFAVTRWYPTTLKIALRETALWPAIGLGAVADGVDVPAERAEPRAPARPLGVAGNVRFGGSLVRRLADAGTSAFVGMADWNVGFVDGGPARLLSDEPLEVRWLPEPAPNTFVADPFLVERDGVRALLVEGFDYAHGRGAIDALVLGDDDAIVRRVRVIDRPTHLSYPYPLEIDGALYVVPENSAGNEVALYRCVRFPDEWERETALFPGFDGVDTTIFAHDGRWWALCTRYSRGSTLALYAFHAASPRGSWTAHALNPIVVDVSRARPAGQPFVVDGVLYRPAQDCSETYGGGLVIARVDELTPTSFRESIVQRHAPARFGKWSDGIHTVSFGDGRIAVDGKRTYRDLRKIPGTARKIRSLARRVFARSAPTNATTVA